MLLPLIEVFSLIYFYFDFAAAEKEGMMANNFNGRSNNGEIEFKIVEYIGIIETQKNGWNKELNIVAWNGNPPKYDIREWDPEHERMSKGITLQEKETERLADLLCQRFGLRENAPL